MAKGRAYGLKEWNQMVVDGTASEKLIEPRGELHLINIECSSCGAHYWATGLKIRNHISEMELCICEVCGDTKHRRVANEK